VVESAGGIHRNDGSDVRSANSLAGPFCVAITADVR
jgi:hypothetical protein